MQSYSSASPSVHQRNRIKYEKIFQKGLDPNLKVSKMRLSSQEDAKELKTKG